MKVIYCFWLFCLLTFISGCHESSTAPQENSASGNTQLTQTTEFLQIIDHTSHYEVNISHYNSDRVDTYILFENEAPKVTGDALLIQIPIDNVVCQGTGHVGYINYLQQEELITAVACAPYICSENISRRIVEDKIHVVGDNNGLNFELLQVLKPSLVLMNSFDDATERMIEQLQNNDIPVIVTTEYFENHPLAKAEWIKLYALLTGYKNIDAKFNALSERYEKSKKMNSNDSTNKPKVFLGLPWKGEWFVAGGNSFQAQLIKDAGGEYVWDDLDSKGAQVIDIETVIEKCLFADFWMNPGDKQSIEQIVQLDERFSSFSAIQKNQVINNNKRLNSSLQGNDYWESGIMEPDSVLLDLIKLFGNVQKEHYSTKYYQKLKVDE